MNAIMTSNNKIRAISILTVICALAAVFWFTENGYSSYLGNDGNSRAAITASDTDNDMAAGNFTAMIEHEIYLPQVVDLTAGSDFTPQTQTAVSDNTDINNALEPQAHQCSFNVAMNERHCF